MNMKIEVVRCEVGADGIALLTIDYPGKSMNVIDQAFMDSLQGCIDRVRDDPAIKGAVVTSGKEAFVAGADLMAMEQNLDRTADDPLPVLFEKYGSLSRVFRNLETCGKPVVAAINGLSLIHISEPTRPY